MKTTGAIGGDRRREGDAGEVPRVRELGLGVGEEAEHLEVPFLRSTRFGSRYNGDD